MIQDAELGTQKSSLSGTKHPTCCSPLTAKPGMRNDWHGRSHEKQSDDYHEVVLGSVRETSVVLENSFSSCHPNAHEAGPNSKTRNAHREASEIRGHNGQCRAPKPFRPTLMIRAHLGLLNAKWRAGVAGDEASSFIPPNGSGTRTHSEPQTHSFGPQRTRTEAF
ncbi:hypothetical protein LY76DRAFT_385976 [Colletotrichum caudatum]|nr:hypothetical protein LY76DRAFT_385976 [Colletotrichum caudatum]